MTEEPWDMIGEAMARLKYRAAGQSPLGLFERALLITDTYLLGQRVLESDRDWVESRENAFAVLRCCAWMKDEVQGSIARDNESLNPYKPASHLGEQPLEGYVKAKRAVRARTKERMLHLDKIRTLDLDVQERLRSAGLTRYDLARVVTTLMRIEVFLDNDDIEAGTRALKLTIDRMARTIQNHENLADGGVDGDG